MSYGLICSLASAVYTYVFITVLGPQLLLVLYTSHDVCQCIPKKKVSLLFLLAYIKLFELQTNVLLNLFYYWIYYVDFRTRMNEVVVMQYNRLQHKGKTIHYRKKRSFVPVKNPHLYQLLDRYRFSGTNKGTQLYRARYPVQT
jgi:hypothetical protein